MGVKMTKVDSPKVFGDGSLTICVDQSGGYCLFVGQTQIDYVESLSLGIDDNSLEIKVSFFKSHDKQTSAHIEESIRTVKQFKWIEII